MKNRNTILWDFSSYIHIPFHTQQIIEHNYSALQDIQKVLLADGVRDCIMIVCILLNGMDPKEDNAQEKLCQ